MILIIRLGVNHVNPKLEEFIQAIKENHLKVIWMCDAVHGNTIKVNNIKTRQVQDIIEVFSNLYL